jgi:GTP-binding protein LepA
VDFSYEVSRSLAACQGILLLVDASQGIQAQTLANFYLAFSQNLSIIPVMNKIDLPHADPVRCEAAMRELLELPPIVNLSETSSEIVKISAKSGLNVEQILPEIIRRIPAPLGDPDGPLKALLFDSWYDEYRGVICLLAIKDGRLRKGDRIRSEQTKQIFEIQQVGLMQLEPRETDTL